MSVLHKDLPEDLWENGVLGASEEFAGKASIEEEKAIDEKIGLQLISIRLQKKLIEELKALAKETGIGYQPYIRQLLTQHVNKKRNAEHLKAIKIALDNK